MILYIEKYTESDKRIQNNHLLYKIHQRFQNKIQHFRNISKSIKPQQNQKSVFYFVIYQISIIHILYIIYFVYFISFVCFVFYWIILLLQIVLLAARRDYYDDEWRYYAAARISASHSATAAHWVWTIRGMSASFEKHQLAYFSSWDAVCYLWSHGGTKER